MIGGNILAQSKWEKKLNNSASFDSSIYYLEQIKKENRSIGNYQELFEADLKLASLNGYNGYFHRARSILDSLKISALNSPEQLIDINAELGLLFKYQFVHDSSLFYYNKAYGLAEKNGLWDKAVTNAINMGELFRATDKFDNAIAQLNAANQMYLDKNISDKSIKYRILGRKAAVFNQILMTDSSIFYSKKAIQLLKEGNDQSNLTYSYNEIGLSYSRLNKIDSSEFFYLQAIESAQNHGLIQEELLANYNLAKLYSVNAKNKKKEGIELYKKIIDVQKRTSIPFDLRDTYSGLSAVYESIGNYKEALFYKELYYQARIKRAALKNDAKFINATEKYKSEILKNELDNVEIELEEEARKFKFAIGNIVVLGVLLFTILFLLISIFRKKRKLDKELLKKQALIQEVHHRTKNNIQFINSLINLQMNTELSSEEKIPLQDVSRRIQAMGLVHEMLYKDDDTDYLEMSDYIEQLVNYQKNVVLSDEKKVEFILEVDSITLDIASATAVGIIVSECINNSIEHAFMTESTPKITISLKKVNSLCTISYSDNGSGISEDIDMQEPSTLGLRLVDIFVRQLKGEYSIVSENGFALTVNFKLQV